MTDDPANSNVPYDWQVNGHPAKLVRDWHPLPVLDPDIGPHLRRSTIHIVREAAPRLATMGIEAIAESHGLGHPAWVEDRETGRIVRLDPDGTRHFEDRTTAQTLADRPTSPRSPTRYLIAALMIGFACHSRPAMAGEVPETQCFVMEHHGFPPGRVIGETFHLPGAQLATGPNDFFVEQTVADDEITSLEILRNECGVLLEGWVSIPRLGRRYLRYLAF